MRLTPAHTLNAYYMLVRSTRYAWQDQKLWGRYDLIRREHGIKAAGSAGRVSKLTTG